MHLKGGDGDDGTDASNSAYNTPSFQNRPASMLIKRKRLGVDDLSTDLGGFACSHAVGFEKYSELRTEELMSEWQARYESSEKDSWSQMMMPSVRLRCQLPFKLDYYVNQFFTGHGDFRAKLHQAG